MNRIYPLLLLAAAIVTSCNQEESKKKNVETVDVSKNVVPKYKASIPASLITPDKVQTEMLGELDIL